MPNCSEVGLSDRLESGGDPAVNLRTSRRSIAVMRYSDGVMSDEPCHRAPHVAFPKGSGRETANTWVALIINFQTEKPPALEPMDDTSISHITTDDFRPQNLPKFHMLSYVFISVGFGLHTCTNTLISAI